ncbi:hypothetical protein PSAB6_100002 [Paraburkholderia sabiae]|nr:hypothetical protein PSAB6_100002 [Paraburkholderia sabiae]
MLADPLRTNIIRLWGTEVRFV